MQKCLLQNSKVALIREWQVEQVMFSHQWAVCDNKIRTLWVSLWTSCRHTARPRTLKYAQLPKKETNFFDDIPFKIQQSEGRVQCNQGFALPHEVRLPVHSSSFPMHILHLGMICNALAQKSDTDAYTDSLHAAANSSTHGPYLVQAGIPLILDLMRLQLRWV